MTSLKDKVPGLLAGLLLTVHGLMLLICSQTLSPTWDEYGHYVSGIWHWQTGNFDCYQVNPPLVRLVATAGDEGDFQRTDTWKSFLMHRGNRPEFSVPETWISIYGRFFVDQIIKSRLRIIPWIIFGAWVTFRFSSDLFGTPGGLISLCLWVFSPTMIGHGSLITPDASAASAGIFAAWRLWVHWKDPNTANTFLAGVAIGLCLSIKATWMIVWPVVLLLKLIADFIAGKATTGSVLREALVGLIALTVVWAAFGFGGLFQPLGSFDFASQTLRGSDSFANYGNRFRDTWLERVPCPLPADYLLGMDVQKVDFETDHNSYLYGRWQDHGWKSYYLYAFPVKTPVGSLIALSFMVGALLSRPIPGNGAYPIILLVGGTPLIILALVSSQDSFSHHYRYLLPALPFVWVTGGCISTILTGRKLAIFIAALISVLALEVVPQTLDSIAFFNVAVGGPSRGHRYLLGSSQNWGQDMYRVEDWIAQHDSDDIWVYTEPQWVRLERLGNWCTTVSKTNIDGDHLEPGWYVLSKELVLENRVFGGRFQESDAVDTIGYTHWVFREY